MPSAGRPSLPAARFEALRQQLGITAVGTDIVFRGRPGFKTDYLANDERDGLCFSFADAFRRGTPALVAVPHFVRDLMRQRSELFNRRLAGQPAAAGDLEA